MKKKYLLLFILLFLLAGCAGFFSAVNKINIVDIAFFKRSNAEQIKLKKGDFGNLYVLDKIDESMTNFTLYGETQQNYFSLKNFTPRITLANMIYDRFKEKKFNCVIHTGNGSYHGRSKQIWVSFIEDNINLLSLFYDFDIPFYPCVGQLENINTKEGIWNYKNVYRSIFQDISDNYAVEYKNLDLVFLNLPGYTANYKKQITTTREIFSKLIKKLKKGKPKILVFNYPLFSFGNKRQQIEPASTLKLRKELFSELLASDDIKLVINGKEDNFQLVKLKKNEKEINVLYSSGVRPIMKKDIKKQKFNFNLNEMYKLNEVYIYNSKFKHFAEVELDEATANIKDITIYYKEKDKDLYLKKINYKDKSLLIHK